MRITTFLLLITLIQVSAATYAQKFTMHQKDASLKEIFNQINLQTGYDMVWNSEDLANTAKVDADYYNVEVSEVLNKILPAQKLAYTIKDKTIVISLLKTLKSFEPGKSAYSLITAHGRVLDNNGEPMFGVTVQVKGVFQLTATDKDGRFTVAAIDEKSILKFSFIGFKTREIRARSDMGDITLELNTSKLDEVKVIAYGTTTERTNTGSMVTVSGKQLENQPVMNPLLALRGLVPGLVITPTAGFASSPVKIEIRGRKNINPLVSGDPLILIDGMPINNINISGGDQTNGQSIIPTLNQFQLNETPTGGQSPLFGLNPKDIASITVLKDADATSIYGSRGANGVILINTKKGKNGPLQVSADVNQGISRVTSTYQLLNTAQYLQLRREALRNDGLPINSQTAPELTVFDNTRNVDWQKELWGGTGRVTNANLGISGGNGMTSFRINGSFGKQSEILTVSGGNQSANLSSSIDSHSANQKFSISLQTIYSYARTDEVNQGALATTLPPNAPPIFDADGALNFGPWDAGGLGSQFPFSSLLQRSLTGTNTLNSSMILKYNFLKGLDISSSFGYNNQALNLKKTIPIASIDPTAFVQTGQATFTQSTTSGWSIEPQINYHTLLGPGKLNLLLGASVQSSYSKYTILNGTGYTDDALINSILNAQQQQAYDAYGQYKYSALFAKINYNLYDRYIINISGRRDGSSRFGPGNQFGNFGAVGAAWNVSEEKWVKKFLPAFFSFIKLRGSYGTTGGDGVGDYQYLSQWSAGSITSGLIPPYNGISSPLINEHAVNQNYKWQTNKELNGGLEISFLNNSPITLQIEHYRNRVSNQLLSFPTPVFTGFSSVTGNWTATVQNSGWEMTIAADRIINTKDFTWSASLNISRNTNIISSYPGIENSPYVGQYIVGKSLNSAYVYHYTGIDPMTGLYSFKDYNHDGLVQSNQQTGTAPLSPNSDNQVALNLDPQFTGGLTSQFNYKGISLSLQFSFKDQLGRNAFATNGQIGGMLHNVPVAIYDGRWVKPGDIALYPGASNGSFSSINAGGYFSQSDGIYTDASYIRLSNLSLQYNLPQAIVKKIGMHSFSFFLNATNVFVITGYKGTDPELQNFQSMPQAKIYTAGLSLNF